MSFFYEKQEYDKTIDEINTENFCSKQAEKIPAVVILLVFLLCKKSVVTLLADVVEKHIETFYKEDKNI